MGSSIIRRFLLVAICVIGSLSLNLSLSPGALAAPGSESMPVPNSEPLHAPQPALGPGPQFTAAQKKQQLQLGAELRKNLQAAIALKEKGFTIPPGDYRFDPTVAAPIELNGVADFKLDGHGATLWFDQTQGIALKNCRNVTLNGFIFDMDPLPWIQGRVDKIDSKNQQMEVTLEPGYAIPPASQWNVTRGVLFFDPGNGAGLNVDMSDGVTAIRAIGPKRLNLSKFVMQYGFQHTARPRSVRVGDRVTIADGIRGNSAQISQEGCANMTYSDITIYASTGLAYFEHSGDGGNSYIRCKLGRRPNSNRLLASNADCFHSFLMKKGPRIESCDFSATGDDLINIHGFFSMIVQPTQGDQLLIASPLGRAILPNSYLRVYRPPNGTYVTEAKVTSLESVKDPGSVALAQRMRDKLKAMNDNGVRTFDRLDLVRVKLDRKISVQACDLVDTYDTCGAGAVVRGNYLHDAHARGILARTCDLLIENNRIERTFSIGIALTPEVFWLEGPFLQRVKIVGNVLDSNYWYVFEMLAGQQQCGGAISVFNSFGRQLFPQTLVRGNQNRDVVITGNRINRPGLTGIFLANALNPSVEDNVVSQPFAAGPDPVHCDWSSLLVPGWTGSKQELDILKAPYFGILLQESKNISISGNQVVNKGPYIRGDIGCGAGIDPALSNTNKVKPLPPPAQSRPPANPRTPPHPAGKVKSIERKVLHEIINFGKQELP
ncbi:MAG TPA: right-handed parallel beta-helix repeat-containing protein [Oculatellaceae cyanobacterium]